MESSSTAIAYQNFVESYIKNHVSIQKHQIVKIETILNLLHSRTSDEYLGNGFKNDSKIIFEGLISCLGGKRIENKHKIKGINSNYNQILVADKDIPVSFTEFCSLKKVNLRSFYAELQQLKRYYNAALCFSLKTIQLR